VRIAARTLAELGFHVVEEPLEPRRPGSPASAGDRPPTLVVGERKLLKEQTDRRVLEALAVVVAGGGVLGVFDAFATSSWLVVPLWLGAFAVVAAIFWFVFGRSYRSDLVVAFVEVDRPTGPGASDRGGSSPIVSVTWLAGHVRSEVRGAPSSRTRRIVRFREASGVVSMLATAIRTFRAQMEATPSPGHA